MKRKYMLITIFVFATFSAYAAKDPAVAKVNGIEIKKSLFEQNYQQNLLFVSGKRVTRESVLSDMINRVLGIERAKKAGLDKDPVVRRKMEDVLYHAQISKDLEPELKKIKVSDQDVKNYYRRHLEYRTAHILLRVRANPKKKEYEAALTQALRIHRSIKKKPSTFAELANKFSQTSRSAVGGDMGYQPAIRLAPQYFEAIDGKKVGHITKPVRTQFGYHIIKVLGVKKYKGINKAIYKKIVYDIKRDKVLANYFKKIKQSANIKIDKKFLE